jgi:hypothetical protein
MPSEDALGRQTMPHFVFLYSAGNVGMIIKGFIKKAACTRGVGNLGYCAAWSNGSWNYLIVIAGTTHCRPVNYATFVGGYASFLHGMIS